MAGQPREAEPVPVCLAPGHNLSIIQDRPAVQPSPNQTCSLSRPLWFPRGRFQALLSPGLLPPCSCVLPPPLSPVESPSLSSVLSAWGQGHSHGRTGCWNRASETAPLPSSSSTCKSNCEPVSVCASRTASRAPSLTLVSLPYTSSQGRTCHGVEEQ